MGVEIYASTVLLWTIAGVYIKASSIEHTLNCDKNNT